MFYLLLAYIIFIIIFAVFSAIGIYHLWRFGYVGDFTKPAITIYIIVSVCIISLTIIAIASRSWPVNIS
ncbi:MAG: hypothetical protein NTW79_02955 [Candidatus Berkelbacteria bacterium]|nr:hypothetical protein [Candidatus Berkelbacteria bacterium]